MDIKKFFGELVNPEHGTYDIYTLDELINSQCQNVYGSACKAELMRVRISPGCPICFRSSIGRTVRS